MSNITPAPVRKESRLNFIGSFLAWVFTGFGLFRKRNAEEVVIYTVNKGFFMWPLILAGFVGGIWVNHWPGSANAWGWIYIITLIYTFVTLLHELNTWKFVFWLGVILLIYLIVRYPLGSFGILPGLSSWLANLQPTFSPDAGIAVSWLLLILFVGSLFSSFAEGRKTFTPNSIEEFHFGRGSEIQDRGGLRFKTNYRDVLETVLGFGAGDLVAYDRANRVVKRYENVLFLFFRWNRLDKVLHQRFALVDNVEGSLVDVHEPHLHNLHSADDNQPS